MAKAGFVEDNNTGNNVSRGDFKKADAFLNISFKVPGTDQVIRAGGVPLHKNVADQSLVIDYQEVLDQLDIVLEVRELDGTTDTGKRDALEKLKTMRGLQAQS